MPTSTRHYALAAVSFLAIGITGAYLYARHGGEGLFSDCQTSRVSGVAKIGGPFTLVDEDGQTVSDTDVLTKPSLVYFGYTYCPDICPTDTTRNAEAVDALEEMGYDVTPVFITVDPGRDTPEVLKEWTDYIHPRMIGLTGTVAQIAEVAKQYATYFKVPDDKADDNYLVDHMTQTYLMLPKYGFVEFFSRDISPEDMARKVSCFIDAGQ